MTAKMHLKTELAGKNNNGEIIRWRVLDLWRHRLKSGGINVNGEIALTELVCLYSTSGLKLPPR